jgi:CO dehydrogenase maturation factor
VVPWSEEVVAADRARVPVIDWPAAAPVVTAVAAVASRLGVLAGPRTPTGS